MRTAAGTRRALTAVAALELDDIQGVILRGYRRMVRARHVFLQIEDRDAFKIVLRDLATEKQASGPFVTVAADWMEKPPAGEPPRHCVNIGFTYSGLGALGVEDRFLKSFPEDFREGAVKRATYVGDTGANDPQTWIEELDSTNHDKVHVVLSLYALTDDDLDDVTKDLRSRIETPGAARVLLSFDASALYDDEARAGFVHFGYRDGLSQPTIAGMPRSTDENARERVRDPLDAVPPGDFLLGHPSQREGYYRVPEPAVLGRNGSFAAFRILEQDVEAFERFLTDQSDGTPEGRELLAARLCGRWRSGVPLVMSPHADSSTVPEYDLNAFDFAGEHPDPEGERCPLGSHIRRANPRRQPGVPGSDAEKRRILRRAMPYGPSYDPARPATAERGLVGLFICGSLRDQFEFVMRKWINDGSVAPGLGRTRDPLAGNIDPPDAPFAVSDKPPVAVTGLPRFVTTRGGAYCFLPSMTALRYLGEL